MLARRLRIALLSVAAPVAMALPGTGQALAADVTAPVISRTVNGTAGEDGWFRGPLNVRWTVTDSESPWTSSGCDARTFTAETAGTTVECRATSAGGTASNGLRVKLDSTPPSVTGATPDRVPDGGGWYNHALSVALTGTDALSGIAACERPVYAGPDTPGAFVSGTCRDRAGNVSASAPFALRYDATGPRVLRAVPARRPDRRGWYTRPVRFRFRARDDLSKGARCAPAVHRGPEGRASVSASCTDRAGNLTVAPFPVRYDAAPPTVVLRARGGGRMAVLRWEASADVRRFILIRRLRGGTATRKVVLRGGRRRHRDRRLSDGSRYEYTLIAVDRAGHRGVDRASARPRRALLGPAADASLAGPPVLRWTPVLGARYYNVQLLRNGRRMLSDWPQRPAYPVPANWVFRGRPQTLAPGTYTWAVFAAVKHGRRVSGSLIGQRRFTVLPPG